MRIISGKFGGRNILAPGNLPVRPTTDFAKSALFNILTNHFQFESIKVLDLFCGTGNISYEFISRGTTSVTCVDNHQACIKFIKETAHRLGMDGMDFNRSDVMKYLDHCEEKFDLIFADPPFESEITDSIPGLVFERELLKENGWLIVEHQSKRVLNSTISAAEIRKYGNCAFTIYKNQS